MSTVQDVTRREPRPAALPAELSPAWRALCCIKHIANFKVSYLGSKMPIIELLRRATGAGDPFPGDAQRALRQVGLCIVYDDDRHVMNVAVANRAPGLATIFEGTVWSSPMPWGRKGKRRNGWAEVLRKHPAARSGDGSFRFGHTVSRVILLPMDLFHAGHPLQPDGADKSQGAGASVTRSPAL